MLCNVESGNVTAVLASLTGADAKEIEALLITGIPPWGVAARYGKYDEFKGIIKSNYIARLQTLIDGGEITVKEANEMFNKICDY